MADKENRGVERSSSSSTNRSLRRCCFMSGLIINDLFNDDILLQILGHLSVQSVMACKLVCRRWFSLISSHDFFSSFISTHERHGQQQSYILMGDQGRFSLFSSELTSSDISFGFLPSGSSNTESSRTSPFEILASSNDLLLYSTGEKLGRNTIYFICNPFTKGWVELPPSPPSTSYHIFSFTCEPYYKVKGDTECVMVNSSCRFKVVRLKLREGLITYPPFKIEVDIFSSETWQWTTMMMHYPFRLQPSCSTSHNELVYWMCYFGVVVYDPYNNKVCYAIDSPPGDGLSGSCFTYNVSSEGSLLAFKISSSIWDFKFWELEDLNQPKWRLKTAVALKEHLLNTCEMFKCAWGSHIILPLAFDPNDKNVIFMWSPVAGVVTINLVTRVFKHFGQHCGVLPFSHSKIKAPCWPTPISALLNQAPVEKKPTD